MVMSDIKRMQLSPPPKDPVQERKRDAKDQLKGICLAVDYEKNWLVVSRENGSPVARSKMIQSFQLFDEQSIMKRNSRERMRIHPTILVLRDALPLAWFKTRQGAKK